MTVRLTRPGRSVRVSVTRTGSRYQVLPMVGGGHYVTIASGDVDSLTDLSQQEFIDDLNAWTSRGHLQVTALVGSIVALVAAAWLGARPSVCIALAVLGAVWLVLARVVEFRRREYFLLYADLDEQAEAQFESTGKTLAQLSRSGILDSVRLEHIHGDWKRNAGATMTVHSDRARIDRGYPRHICSNLDPPPIRLRAQNKTLCFLPDRLILEERGRKAAIAYDMLNISCHTVNMRWYSAVPNDAKVVGQSWRYVNKDGGPDRRFNNNHIVQIILVAELTLQSPTGLEIVLQASATKAAFETAEALNVLGRASSEAALGAEKALADRGQKARYAGGTIVKADAPHHFESVRLLRSAATWRDIELPRFLEAVARDGATKSGMLSEGVLVTFLSDFRDLFCEFDACTRRTSVVIGAAATAELVAPLGELRTALLQAFAAGVVKIRDQLSVLPADESRSTRKYIADLAEHPGKITSFNPELLR